MDALITVAAGALAAGGCAESGRGAAISRWMTIIAADPRLARGILFVPAKRGNIERSVAW
jgi:hypothetical protein